MWKLIGLCSFILIVLACSSPDPNAEQECEKADQGLVGQVETGLTIDGKTLLNAQTVRSRAYENMWFLGAEISGLEGRRTVGVWGVDDLKNPGFIWWANDIAQDNSTWGDEVYFTTSTDGIGRARFCSEREGEQG